MEVTKEETFRPERKLLGAIGSKKISKRVERTISEVGDVSISISQFPDKAR